MIGGAMMSPESEPTSRPPKVAVTALERCEPGTPLASTPVAAEGATPSPRPTRKRDASSAVKENCAQTGAMSVPKDQSMTPAKSTSLPPYFCASQPPGICVKA